MVATISGLLFTFFRTTLPGVPALFSQWSFGMLAPFQAYLPYNEELVAFGRNAWDVWEEIDLHTYLPYGKGEASIRSYLSTYRKWSTEELEEKYKEYARQIQHLEEVHEHSWEEIKLELHRWPRSAEGYLELRQNEFIEITPVIQIP